MPITEPNDRPYADHVLTSTLQWNDPLGAGEIGVRAWRIVTDTAIGETSTVVLTGKETDLVWGLAATSWSPGPPPNPITLASHAR